MSVLHSVRTARITDDEINIAGSNGWPDLLRKHSINPDEPYVNVRAAHKGFRGVIVTQSKSS